MAKLDTNKLTLSRREWEQIGLSTGWLKKKAAIFDAERMKKFVSRTHDLYAPFQQLLEMTDEQSALIMLFDQMSNNPYMMEKYMRVH